MSLNVTMATVKAAKTTLRKNMKNRILSIPMEAKKRQSQEIHKKLLSLPVFKKSQRVSIYLSTDHEVSTGNVVKSIFESGKTCFVPRYSGNNMDMVKLTCMKDWEALPLTKWSIKQPDISEEREDALKTGGLDLIIVPGVAFTHNGARLGHGKGYYDYYLTRLQNNQTHKAFSIALAFKEQMLDDLPTVEHDVQMDKILYCD